MTATSSSAVSADPVAVAVRAIHAMADGNRADFDHLYHPRAADRENRVQPPSSRVPGPPGFYSTALWLRAAFANLHYDIHHAVAEDNLVAVNSTMNGRHVGPWGRLHRRRHCGRGFPADEQDLCHDPIALVPDRRRHDH
jgi:predicted ester cyclase